MSEKNKDETKKTNNTLVSLITGIVVALIATAASYNYWHDTNIRVTFHADNEKELTYQVFYTEDNSGHFNENQSVKQVVPAGYNFVEMMLPAEHITSFRLDFGEVPETVVIRDLKISGDSVTELSDFNSYGYNQTNKHVINEDGSLTVISDKRDPYMVVNQKLDIYSSDYYNWLKMWSIAGGSFIVAFLLAMLINRKKK